AIHSMQLPGQDIENSFAVDQDGAVYVVTSKALYRFDVGPGGRPKITWREGYPNIGVQKPGQGDAGSGTTPTLMDHGLISITDNADPMDILVYRRGRNVSGKRLVCRQPVFHKGASASDNSLVAAGRGMVVENNYGPIMLGPDNGSVYVGVLGGLVMLRDAIPPPPRHVVHGRPRIALKRSYRRARRRPCGVGKVTARVRGKDVSLISRVDFLMG